MRIFEVRPDEQNWRYDYEINAHRAWRLPPVWCLVCGKVQLSGLVYPSLILPPGIDPKPYQSGRPIIRERLEELALPLRKLLDSSLPLGPGTGFGPLRGIARGRHGDFSWTVNSMPLVSPSALAQLRSAGISTLVGSATEIFSRNSKLLSHLEIQIEPRASFAPDGFPPGALNPCPGCGRFSIAGSDLEKWNTYKVLRSSVPEDLDLFRIRGFGNYILASERFVDAARRLSLSNIAFSELSIADYAVARTSATK